MSDFSQFPGQWIGEIEGTNNADAIINIDMDRPLIGSLLVNDTAGLPFAADISLDLKEGTVLGKLDNFYPYGKVAKDARVPTTGQFAGTLDGNRLGGTWETDINTNGTFFFMKVDSLGLDPGAADEVMSWDKFREWVLKEDARDTLIYRGHTDSKHYLITSFHRSGRRNLLRYDREDIPRLRRYIEPTVGATYDIRDPEDYGCLLNLAQHHGFPTPLLDWTESPFVAAYFAYAALPKRGKIQHEHVRIFIFDYAQWPVVQVATIAEIRPVFSRLQLRTKDNVRALPQQSVNMFSNLLRIEPFIKILENEKKRRFLRRIDLPAADRSRAMRDLEAMGVTAASLFPGVEGVCKTLTEKYF